MEWETEVCYRALKARDPRFDGLFFVGVSSTGVYCRPVCHARTPKEENCAFFDRPAAAEKAGYRPCLLCRPELAPGRSRVDAVDRLADVAVRLIEDGRLEEMSLNDLAEELGVTDRHLRRVVMARYGVSPIELAQTQRLLSAKRLLTDTRLPVGEVAMASGFSSVRRLNALFKERYRLSPSALRRRVESPRETVRCRVAFRPPYAWDEMLAFLGDRAIPGVELVENGVYRRAVAMGAVTGHVAVRMGEKGLEVEVTPALAVKLPAILRRIRRLFDTAAEPLEIAEALGELGGATPGLRVPGAWEGFEIGVRAILGQQISVKGARTLAGRIAGEFGPPIESPWPGLSVAFPSAERMAEAVPDEIAKLGVIGARAASIIGLAGALARKELRLLPGGDPQRTINALLKLKGIGPWTAEYIAMRALSYPDAFPRGDLGLLKALGTTDPRAADALVERYRPWRSYAALYLWRTL